MKSEIYKNSETNESGLLNLSVFAGSRFFSYAIFNEDRSAVLQIGSQEISKENFPGKNTTQAIEFLISDFRLAGRKYKHADIAVMNNDFSLMPEAFASKELAKDMIGFSSGLTQIRTTDTIVFNELNFAFTIDAELLNLFERNFKQAVIRHSGAVSVLLMFGNHSLKNCDLFLNFHTGSFEITAKKDQKLLFYNIFSFESNEDILYYLLFMMEQYQLSPLTVKLRLAGAVNTDSDLVKAIKRYIRNVDFAVSDKSFSSSFASLQLADHNFFTLLNQHLCAS